MLPVDGDSGCNKYRERLKDFDVWQNEKFVNGCREKPAMEYLQMFPSRATVRVQSAKAASTTIQDSESVVVTLTTIPTRLIDQPDHNSGIRPGLKTILEQVDVKYEVHLNIPYAYKYKRILLPDWMEEWTQKYPHLKIFRCPDFGPITKLYPTLQRVSDPSTILITVDDDLIYTNDFVKAHLEERKQYPDCALGFAGITSIEDDGTCGRYHFASTQPHDTRVRLLEGYKTVSYKREFFDSEFDEFAFTHWNDDVSISAYLGYKNIKKIVLKTRNTNDFTQRVESFPVIAHSPVAGGVIGCNIFRLDDGLRTHSDVVSDEWYKLGYLER
jgi:hypothetical protein